MRYEPTHNLTEEYIALGRYDYNFPMRDKLQSSSAWTFEFATLMLVSALYAHLIEEPLVQRFRRFSDRYTRAPRVKQHSR